MKRYFFFMYLFPLSYFAFLCVPQSNFTISILNTIFALIYVISLLMLINYDTKSKKNRFIVTGCVLVYFSLIYLLNFYNSHYLIGIKHLQRPIILFGFLFYPLLAYIPSLLYISFLKSRNKDNLHSGFSISKAGFVSFLIIWLMLPFIIFLNIMIFVIPGGFYTLMLMMFILTIIIMLAFLLFINSFEKLPFRRKLLFIFVIVFYATAIVYFSFMLFFYRLNSLPIESIHYFLTVFVSLLIFVPLFIELFNIYISLYGKREYNNTNL